MNSSDIKNRKSQQFVSFSMDNYLMGIDILKIREIIQLTEITTVQNSPDFIWGLMNLRGKTITVVDLGVVFGLSYRKITPDSHNIIMKHLDLSIVVDNIGDIFDIPGYGIEPSPANIDKTMGQYLQGVARLDNDVMAILCPEKIIKKISMLKGQTEV